MLAQKNLIPRHETTKKAPPVKCIGGIRFGLGTFTMVASALRWSVGHDAP
jgi:hypothetical protein